MITIININQAKEKVLLYFEQNAEVFIPPLNTRVDISSYAEKICRFAQQFWVNFDGEVAGFMACYFNDYDNKIGYITTLSVSKKFQGKRIGSLLMERAISYAKENNFEKIHFEVSKINHGAISFHKKMKFIKIKETESCFLMERIII